ncbi:MAG TPA: ATP-binding protein [Thermoleophilaceae bacterium]|nr:ATP-binding protein [Thermoleophilaceae bacterium]
MDKQTSGRTTSGAESVRVQITGDSGAAARARAELARLRSMLDDPILENVRLLVTELVTNSVRHARASDIELLVVVSRTRVHVEVANPGGGFEPRPSGPEDSETGWGLFLVDRLSDDWGVTQGTGADYQRVWFELSR